MNRATFLFVPCSLVWAACSGDERADAPRIDADAVELAEVSQALVPGEVFTFENEKTNDGTKMCIGVDGASTDLGARLKLLECDGSDSQRWRSIAATDSINSAYENVKARGRCMGVDAGTNAGADIALLDCESRPAQHWFFAGSTAALFNIINSRADALLCIGVDGGEPVSGAQLKQFECDFEAASQRWR